MNRPDLVRALAAIALVFGTASAAVLASYHPAAAPPPYTVPPGTLPSYWGDRVLIGNAVDVEPPQGCLALTYPTDEAALRALVGDIPEYYYYGYWFEGDMLRGAAPPMAGTTAAQGAAAPPDHSTTNNQVGGVDEADVVKTDGWFIYTAMGGKVVTTRSYPAGEMAVVSTIDLGGYAYGIFVVGDRLAVILQPQYAQPSPYGDIAYAGFAPYYYNPEVEVRVYDITDRAAPEVLYNYSMSGSYAGARMVGDHLYLVSDYSIYRIGDDLRLPTVSRNGLLSELAPSAIGVPPGVHNTTFLTSVITLNVTAASTAQTFSFLTKGGGQLFVSARNLYILGSSYEYSDDYRLLRTETVVSKLSFYKGEVKCYFGARVPGTVLNQFSADEMDYAGKPHLRLATTTRAGDWANSSAGVYVLNEKLELVGSVEGIAPGETIQTSRFVGERGYVVTFRRVDPLFVLDLRVPDAPAVIGELTLPGFSQYLQAIDADHLVGIGVDGTEAGRVLGLKLSLFDVSDPAHPSEVDGVTFGPYAYSEAQYDHHAVLWIPARGLLVIPLQTYDATVDPVRGTGGSWQGAVVYAVDPQAGFTEKVRIAHPAIPQGTDYYGVPYSFTPQVRRSLYIGDSLYTISDYSIQANAFDGWAVTGFVSTGAPAPWIYGYGGGGGVATAVPPSAGASGPVR
jgi:uncharacterized secreted protein with C-terminal beta-propeller domain